MQRNQMGELNTAAIHDIIKCIFIEKEQQMEDQPPFQIDDTIINLLAKTSELVGKVSILHKDAISPKLRRENRIKLNPLDTDDLLKAHKLMMSIIYDALSLL